MGAEATRNWYERNLKIFVNISRIVTSADDRILVVIGSGHLPLLAHFVQGAERYALASAETYLA